MSEYYGWLSKIKNTTGNRRDSGTDTGKYFRFYFEKYAKRSDNFRSKNLFVDNDRYFYVLCIGKGKTTWAPYPFITQIENLTLILTQDEADGKGKIWIVENNDNVVSKDSGFPETYKLNGIEIKKQTRDNAGDYYSLSLRQIKTMRKKINSDEPDYYFDTSETSGTGSIEQIVSKIMNRNEEGGEEQNV